MDSLYVFQHFFKLPHFWQTSEFSKKWTKQIKGIYQLSITLDRQDGHYIALASRLEKHISLTVYRVYLKEEIVQFASIKQQVTVSITIKFLKN